MEPMAAEAGQISLAERAYQLILGRILDGRLEPGGSISVPALSRFLDMGRSPVREAVQRLINEGLAENIHNKGAAVTSLHASDLPDFFETKEPLEGLAARRAAGRISTAQKAELRSMVDRQLRAIDDGLPPSTMMRLDIDFHYFVADISASIPLAATLKQFTTRTHLVVPSSWSDQDNSRPSVEEHGRIADAVIRGDADAAEYEARRHTRNVCVRLGFWLDGAELRRSEANV